MNITFTGSENLASNMMFDTMRKDPSISLKLLCTLNNEGKNDLDTFEPILDEFRDYKGSGKSNKVLIEVKNALTPTDYPYLMNSKKLRNEYNPHCVEVKINNKPVSLFRNKVYILDKLSQLASDIASKKPVELLFQKNRLDANSIIVDMFGGIDGVDKKSAMAMFLNTDNIKLNAELIAKSLKNAINSILKGKARR